MNTEKKAFIKKAKSLRKMCIQELHNRNKGTHGINEEVTIEHLKKVIIPELNWVILRVSLNILPCKNLRYLESYACAVRYWAWDMRHENEIIGLLADLDASYKKL